MRAADGAIEGVRIADDAISLEVIGNVEPIGMCGSGLVDCVAELVGAGLLDHSGRFVPDETAAEIAPALAERLTVIGKERVFVLHWRGADPANAVFLSQRDVRELQFAKASIATGWQILLGELGVEARGRLPGAARRLASAPTCRRRARSGSASCRGWRCRGSCRPATSRGRGRRSRL